MIRALNKKIDRLEKIDYILISVLMLIYGIFSFINLGDTKSINTFKRSDPHATYIIELNDETIVDKIKLFQGEKASNYTIYISNDGIEFDYLISKEKVKEFYWDMLKIRANTKYIKIDFPKKSSLGEIGIYSKDKLLKPTTVKLNNKIVKEVIDEQNLIPEKTTYMNSTYFDEIYFARTAYEYVNNLELYEWTHPPLGKLIQAIPIYITKYMSPFNYRLMGNIAGIILLAIMYIYGIIFFKKRKYGICAAGLMMLDTFHFAHSRMGTIDTYLVIFVSLSILFMYLFITKEKHRYLLLSGLFFGLSACIKWTGLYQAPVLCIMYFKYIITNKKINFKFLSLGTLYFVIIPVLLYTSIFLIFSNNYYKTNNIKNIIKETELMYNYHSKLKDDHFYSSKWYTWPISYKPVLYYKEANSNYMHGTISGVGNIIIWILGIVGVFYTLIKYIYKRDDKYLLLILAILSLWLPYMFINRVMFLYHYFPVLPFIFLALLNMLVDLNDEYNIKSVLPTVFILAALFFITYYPVISGLEINNNYAERLQIFKSWIF